MNDKYLLPVFDSLQSSTIKMWITAAKEMIPSVSGNTLEVLRVGIQAAQSELFYREKHKAA